VHIQQDQEKILAAITDFADIAHGNQMRKYTPERYIVHPARVMRLCREYTDDVTVLAAALLHDVLEDTPTTAAELSAFLTGLLDASLAERSVHLVVELTDVYIKDNYPKLNRRTRKNKETERLAATSPEAQTIKYADIIDNASEIVTADPDFARTFVHECRVMINKMTKGDPALRKRAVETINDCVSQLPRA
jgi:(p)ppGpp synthase/HD superfamily hydrolase